jgi:acyl-coenzyme A synthetase/AMP-(fatty) acid ligase
LATRAPPPNGAVCSFRSFAQVSALDVERVLLEHPAVAEAAVVGAPDEKFGEKITAVVRLRPGQTLDLPELKVGGGRW